MPDYHYFFIKGVVTRNGYTFDAVYGTEKDVKISDLYNSLSSLKINIGNIKEIDFDELIHFNDHVVTTDLRSLKYF